MVIIGNGEKAFWSFAEIFTFVSSLRTLKTIQFFIFLHRSKFIEIFWVFKRL